MYGEKREKARDGDEEEGLILSQRQYRGNPVGLTSIQACVVTRIATSFFRSTGIVAFIHVRVPRCYIFCLTRCWY